MEYFNEGGMISIPNIHMPTIFEKVEEMKSIGTELMGLTSDIMTNDEKAEFRKKYKEKLLTLFEAI